MRCRRQRLAARELPGASVASIWTCWFDLIPRVGPALPWLLKSLGVANLVQFWEPFCELMYRALHASGHEIFCLDDQMLAQTEIAPPFSVGLAHCPGIKACS